MALQKFVSSRLDFLQLFRKMGNHADDVRERMELECTQAIIQSIQNASKIQPDVASSIKTMLEEADDALNDSDKELIVGELLTRVSFAVPANLTLNGRSTGNKLQNPTSPLGLGGLALGFCFHPSFFNQFWFQPSGEGFYPPPTPSPGAWTRTGPSHRRILLRLFGHIVALHFFIVFVDAFLDRSWLDFASHLDFTIHQN